MSSSPPPASTQPNRDFLTNLSLPAILCTACASFPIAAEIAGSLTILIVYGRHAYFDQGLRLLNWKKGTLSTGEVLASPWMFLTGVLTVTAMVFSLYAANEFIGRSRTFLSNRRGGTTLARLAGATALFALWYWICLYKHVPFMHPSSLAPLIGSIVLTFKVVRPSSPGRSGVN